MYLDELYAFHGSKAVGDPSLAPKTAKNCQKIAKICEK
jgi:hypothetical protein